MILNKLCLIISFLSFLSIHAQDFSTIHPKNNQVLSNSVELEWNTKAGANNYLVQLSDKLDFLNPSEYSTKQNSIKLFAKNLTGRSYYWRVVAKQNSSAIDTTRKSKFSVFLVLEQDSLNLWLVADSVIKDNSNNVSKWIDLSDSNVVVEQTTTNNQPLWTDSVLNNFPAVYFNSSSDQFNFIMDVDRPNFTLATIYNTNETVFKGIRMMTGVNNWFIGPYNDRYRAFAGTFSPSVPINIGVFANHTAYVKNDTINNYVNGIDIGAVSAASRPGTGWKLGLKLNGFVPEIIILNGYVEDSIVDVLNSYLMDKYAPPVNLGADRTVCNFPDSINLEIDYALDYLWSTGDTTPSTVIDSAGKYYVTITDMFDRTSIDSIWFILDTSDYQIDFGFQDTTICMGDSLELIAGSSRFSYQWSTLDTSNSISVKNPGTYKVSVKNCKGNYSADSVTLYVNNPLFSLGQDTTACFNSLIQLQADSSFSNVTYLWSTGETSATIVADSTTSYNLKVTDAYSCFFTDTIQVSIDSSLFVLTLGPDTSLCQGNSIGLQNPNSSITSYLWSTGNTLSTQLIDTAGLYVLEVSSNRCAVTDSIQVSIQGFAPAADFDASNFCIQDTVQFMDLSTAVLGDTLVSWQWDFNDGGYSTDIDPVHSYDSVKMYRVRLEIINDKNCSDTVSKIVTIQPKPSADFALQTIDACSRNPVDFADNSTILSGSIDLYLWDFGDSLTLGDTSSNIDPVYVFDTLGSYNVSLIVESNHGCRDTVVKTTEIFPSPLVKFDYFGSCLNDSTKLVDQTSLAQGAIKDYLWAVNGQISLLKNPAIKFLSAGHKTVILRVRTVAGCQETLRDTIQIFENPVADFASPVGCVGDDFIVNDLSSSSDSIVEYRYIFNQVDTSYLASPSFNAASIGNYNLNLRITTTNACTDSIQKQIQISERPTARFNILNNGSGVPFDIAIDNTSKDATSYEWNFGDGANSTEETPMHSYQDSGSYNIQLKAYNASGCVDSSSKLVVALPYFLDALLEQVILDENVDGEITVSVRIINAGNNTIESIKMTADLNNQIQIREVFDNVLYRGEGTIYTFTGGFVKDSNQKLDFVCVKIEGVNQTQDDVLINNQVCEKGFNQELVLTAYPNPTSETLILEYVLPQEGELIINVYDQLGRKVLKEISTQADEGFYQSRLNVIQLRPGIYYYSFSHNGEEINGSFLKR